MSYQPSLILRGDETGSRRVSQRHRFAAHLDDADTASRQHVAVLVDDPGLQPLQRTTERGQSPGFTPGRRDGSVQHGEQVGVDLVDHQARGHTR